MLFGDVWFVVGWNHLLVADLKYFMTFPLFGMMIPTDRRRFPKMVVPPNYPNSSIFSIWNLWGSPNFFETPKKCCHSWNALFNHQSSYDDPWRLHCFVDDLATPPVFLPQWPRFHAGDVLGMLYADGLPVGVLSLKGKVHWIGAGRCHRDFTWDALPTVPNPLSSELRSLFVQTRKVHMFDWNPVIDMELLIEKHPR